MYDGGLMSAQLAPQTQANQNPSCFIGVIDACATSVQIDGLVSITTTKLSIIYKKLMNIYIYQIQIKWICDIGIIS